MNEDTHDPGDRRIDELTSRTADDVAALAHEYAGVARHEVAVAGERALWPAAIAAIGGLIAVVGTGLLIASPAVPSANKRLKRRVRFVAFAYLGLGAVGAVIGGGALLATVRSALPRTRHNVKEAVDVVRDRI
jgi:hypothetical protein